MSFYINEDFYSGEVILKQTELVSRYYVDLGNEIQFNIYMGEEGIWASEDRINANIIKAVGLEIERRDINFENEVLQPAKYFSNKES